jgi:urease accessory protein
MKEMSMRKVCNVLLSVSAILAPGAAAAHVVPGDPGGGFVHGFLHPLGGADHALAMVAIGILAWQFGARALWLLPSIFVAVMAAGWALGLMGIALPHIEAGIAASVVVFGAAILIGVRTPVLLCGALAAIFALFHGYAHGAEMPATGSPALYAAGALAATALLHIVGIGVGVAIGRLGSASATVLRAAGLAIAVTGAVILVQAV